MAFDDSTISNVRPRQSGADLLITWDSTAPAGTIFQVYIDGSLIYHGTSKSIYTALPPDTLGHVNVGAVLASEAESDLSSSLPTSPYASSRAYLDWEGGTYLDDNIQGFHVYASRTPGGAVDLTNLVGDLPAYGMLGPGDGFGVGGFGDGGFGLSASSYEWRSERLADGVWSFRVKAYDVAGNEASGWNSTVTTSSPPGPPPADAGGIRVHYTYNSTTHVAVLTWSNP